MRRLIGLVGGVGALAVVVLLSGGAASAQNRNGSGNVAQAPEDMARANRAASKVVTTRLATERPADFKLLKDVKSAEIIVVRGSYDHVESVLNAVGVPHLVIGARELEQLELNAKQLVMVNCSGVAELSDASIGKLERFVRAGGFLYTTDWALSGVIERAFPNTIKFNGRTTDDDVVEVEVVKKDNVFLQHLQLTDTNPKWWLEGASYPIEILDPKRVEVLISSSELKAKYGASPVAVTFAHGDGRVLHIVSHFYLQQGDARTVAEKSSAKKMLSDNKNISAPAAGALAEDADVKGTSAGDLQSAYSAQQLTTNIVVSRKKDQARIDTIYNRSVKQGKGKLAGQRVKVLEQGGGKATVRTMNGEEYTFDADALE